MRHYFLHLLNHEYQNIERLPARYEITGSTFVAWVLIVFGVIFGAESIFLTVESVLAGTFPDSILGTQHIILGPIGALFLVWGFNQFFIEGELVINQLTVSCAYKKMLGKLEWSELLSSYQIRKRIGKRGNQLLYCIWLWHDKSSRRVKIYQSWSSLHWEEQADFYAQLFRLQRTEHEKGK